jgi:hypothetical protein
MEFPTSDYCKREISLISVCCSDSLAAVCSTNAVTMSDVSLFYDGKDNIFFVLREPMNVQFLSILSQDIMEMSMGPIPLERSMKSRRS